MGDLEFFDKQVEKGLIERLRATVEAPFARLDYTEAVEILAKEVAEGKIKFVDENTKKEAKIEWGIDLSREMERYLTDVVFKGPLVVINYPAAIKSFYIKLNDDEKTV